MNTTQAFREQYDDPEVRKRAEEAARRFVAEETEFHLGALPTEQPHPYTQAFSQTVQSDGPAGIDLLLSVDQDIPPVARRVLLSGEYARLVDAVAETAAGTGRVCFSGCGSTGRLSVMLEEMWRQFWEDRAGVAPGTAARTGDAAASGKGAGGPSSGNLERANRATSVMTGGDRALIRSVENFEDYPEFGARQVAELGLRGGDLFIAITEGGETPSVIGSAHEALRRGATVFLVYNNPTPVLREHITRSRELIDHPAVTVLDLFTGQMALSGSTRMQATTMEMLVLGAALEEGMVRAAGDTDGTRRPASEADLQAHRIRRADHFAALVLSLRSPRNARVLAELAAAEASLYEQGGLVTYTADRFLLDIFSDTTERTPTFALPPFRPADDRTSRPSWAFAKHPGRPTKEAWHAMLRRAPRGLAWESKDYKSMDAPQALVDTPPILDEREIDRYLIGNEPDPGRFGDGGSLFVQVEVDGAPSAEGAAETAPKPTTTHRRALLALAGSEAGAAATDSYERVFALTLDLPPSPVYLWHHLAVKLVFNTVSTATMGMLGRIRGNWMIQVDPTNKKLIDRGSRIIAHLTGIPYEDACEHLYRALEARHRAEKAGVNIAESPVKMVVDFLANSL